MSRRSRDSCGISYVPSAAAVVKRAYAALLLL